ncbi:MAG: ATPase, partial [Micavibrio sp.]|nr:ATPase [Micavibrio sp.]HCK33031.1 ATPase [Rhodospirillaceae bacterium]
QTGHAVYTTAHTTGVSATIRRMISAFEPEERRERAYALMETMRLIVTQALVPKVGGGRMGVREWMRFDDQVREKLLDMDFDKWGTEVQRMIPNYGQTMNTSAAKAFEDGLIEKRHYLMLTGAST